MRLPPNDRASGQDPWFRRRPRAAVAVIAVLSVAVTVVGFAVGSEADAGTLLYALPVTLTAVTFGRRAGIAAAVAATVALGAWVVAADVTLSPIGWLARILPVALLGGLVGHATDALEAAVRTHCALQAAEGRRRDAAEVNDSVVQRLAVAKWRAEAAGADDAAELIGEAMEVTQDLVASLLAATATDDRLTVRGPATAREVLTSG